MKPWGNSGASWPTVGNCEPGRWKYYLDRKSTRLNSSHVRISYAVFCLKKKKKWNRSNSAHVRGYHTGRKIYHIQELWSMYDAATRESPSARSVRVYSRMLRHAPTVHHD